MAPQLLILDLDETLVYAAEAPLGRAPDFRVGDYFVYRRPFVDECVRTCLEWFEVAVWSSSRADYAATMVEHLFDDPGRLAFIWGRERCVPRLDVARQRWEWIKDLKKVKRRGYTLDRVLVVDDSPEKLQRNYGNLICVTPFEGGETDVELALLPRFLHDLRSVPDVRRIEKRHWQRLVEIRDIRSGPWEPERR